jgi:4-amino-4-deoxy-L-arabinose transferase-like glycosyltransferase
MRTRTMAAILSLAFVPPALAQAAAPMTPAQAVAAATAAANGQVEGVFEFAVTSTGAVGFAVYLNSASDYRDPANLSVELHSAAITALKAKLGGFPEEVLKGKRIRVKGVARRVSIPRRDGTTYFQTRIDVDSVDQIEILG